jgi:tRNA pseudouridine32 synthase/23S rRNA pseudouridine746 synthase
VDLPAGVDGCVLHVDPHLIVLNKPSGLLSVPGRGPENADCLSARAQALWPDALVVHRLDMGTSGLMCMARGTDAQRSLSNAFAQRLTHKRYEAIVAADVDMDELAHPSDAQGWHTIDLPLVLDWPNRPRSIVSHTHGKPSVTRWRVLERGVMGQHTRLALEPVTGRSHQLRVHLQALGHPILGDALYASGPAQAAAPRLLLHATQLSLPHPFTGQHCEWHSAAPF